VDKEASKLYYFHNVSTDTSGTSASPPPAIGFEATMVDVLLSINASTGSTSTNPREFGEGAATDVTIQGIGFRDAKSTYLAPHGVPSGGDWALQR
jgi:hypothetical protein